MDETVNQLLNEVKQISDESKKISKLKGENFNIFQILKLSRDEDNLHSRLIKALLDPKGKHEKHELFLRLFLETLYKCNCGDQKGIKKINPEIENLPSCYVTDEKYIGLVDNDKQEGGIVDIFISHDKFDIAIENKIDALDQEKQLTRYYNFLVQRRKNNCLLLYLTLDGKSPSKKSIADNNKVLQDGENFYCISYEEHILKWLEKCHEKTHDDPILRETIKQYIILIKKLTGQITNEMDYKLKNKIINNYQSAKLIREKFDKAIAQYVKENFVYKLKERLEQNKWIFELSDNNNFIKIRRQGWEKGIAMKFQFNTNFMGFIYGLKINHDDFVNGNWDENIVMEYFPSDKDGSFFEAKGQNSSWRDRFSRHNREKGE
ncbi:MAG: PD-(D/E)XK nuclease family protein [Bacteroidales bacterium]|nr:PD-(D/E)XK nuclease family protein [Bacteroidales bacterium]